MQVPAEARPRRRNRILLVEDDASLRLALSDRLVREGFEVEICSDGDEGAERGISGTHDLLILDVMLPGKDGFEIARELRSREITKPILMLTARGEVTDRVVGLHLGADDYLTKPFEFIELLARIQALLRRAEPQPGRTSQGVFEFGDLRVDFRRAEVVRDGEPVQLSARELQLLRYLVDHPGVVLSRNELLDAVWGYDAMPTTRTVDVHVARLRQKVETDPRNPQLILTVRGLGYKFASG